MGRAKLRLELITKDKTRNTTYQKRKLGIMKKANEFTILCDVKTVIIVYPPNSNEPEIWPENHDDVKKTIASYKSKKGETAKRTYDLNDFFQDRKKKIEDELLKARKKSMEAKYATWFDELNVLDDIQLRQFAMALEGKENLVRAHLELKKRNMNIHLPIYDLGLGQGLQIFNRHNEFGWFDNDAMAASPSSMKFEQPMGPGYPPEFEGGVVYNNKLNQWAFQQQVMHGGLLPEDFVMQEVEGQVNNRSCYE